MTTTATESTTPENIVRLEPETTETTPTTKARIKEIKTLLLKHIGENATRDDLDEFCGKLGFNDFFHVRRLVNLEVSQGYVNTNKYLDAINGLNDVVGPALGIKIEKPARSPRSRNPISTSMAHSLLDGETVEIDGSNYKLVKA